LKKINVTAREKRKEVLLKLEKFGHEIYEQIEKGIFPNITMPSRSTDNIYYSPDLRQYVLGDKKVRRSAGNIRHLKPFTQLVWMAYFVHELTLNQKTSTLRDVFYSAQAYDILFQDQDESDDIITDLETILGCTREDFNVFPEESSAVFGDLTIEYTVPNYEGKRLNLTSHPDGVMIGPALTSAEFIETSADKVIAIEKGGLFTRFIEEMVLLK
jgi:DNA topoisomerase-6 subunit A